jgi:hypothetical protein
VLRINVTALKKYSEVYTTYKDSLLHLSKLENLLKTTCNTKPLNWFGVEELFMNSFLRALLPNRTILG